MVRYLLVSVAAGLGLGIVDAIIAANPVGRRLLAAYLPIARNQVPMVAGIVIDLVYGFILAALFLLLFESLPGEAGIVKGLSFALGVWVLRVVTYVASHWMMFTVPNATLGYTLVTGALQFGLVGVLFGLVL